MRKRVVQLIKKRAFVVSAVLLSTLLGMAVILISLRSGATPPRLTGPIKSEDVREIKRAISSTRWATARACFRKRQYERLFRFCCRDVAVGGLVEVHSRSGPAGEKAQVQGPTANYVLVRTDDGWLVIAAGFRK
jgi:hypothetical protein